MMNPWGSIPLGAKDGEKNPKDAKGGRRAAVTLLFCPISTRSMSASSNSFRSPARSRGKCWTNSFSWLAMASAL